MTEGAVLPRLGMGARILLALMFLGQIGALIVAAYFNRYELNPDGVSYLNIARYYADGRLDLAISGVWSPLLSWLLVPLLKVGLDPLVAGRAVVALSAVLFTLGSLRLFRQMRMPAALVVLGTAVVMLRTVGWSVQQLTPDLLVSACLLIGVSQQLAADWSSRWLRQIAVGVIFGLAYYSKAIGLPMACVLLAATTILRIGFDGDDRRKAIVAFLVSSFCFALTCAPWIAVLSQRTGRLTFSTTSALAHAFTHPDHRGEGHPTVRIGVPTPPRTWRHEDPDLSLYPRWSPFESRRNLEHQLRLIHENSGTVVRLLSNFDEWHLGTGALAAAAFFLLAARWRQPVERWAWSVFFVLANAMFYVPVYASQARYYWFSYPFMFVAVGGLSWLWLRDAFPVRRAFGLAVIFVSFALASHVGLREALGPAARTVPSYVPVARGLELAGLNGPVVSEEDHGLMVAYLTREPWYGKSNQVAELARSGASVAVIRAGTPMDQAIQKDPAFEDITQQVLSSQTDTSSQKFKVFRIKHGPSKPS